MAKNCPPIQVGHIKDRQSHSSISKLELMFSQLREFSNKLLLLPALLYQLLLTLLVTQTMYGHPLRLLQGQSPISNWLACAEQQHACLVPIYRVLYFWHKCAALLCSSLHGHVYLSTGAHQLCTLFLLIHDNQFS